MAAGPDRMYTGIDFHRFMEILSLSGLLAAYCRRGDMHFCFNHCRRLAVEFEFR